jgi:hypothetical protein
MPHLLLFAPCAKAIIDREDASISMISILSGVRVSPIEQEELPNDAVVPMIWVAVSIWEREPDDENKTFEQRFQVIQPDEEVQAEATTAFTLPRRTHQNLVNATAFPVGQTGIYQLRLSVREVGTEQDWIRVADYPMEVVYESAQTEQQTGLERP